MNTFPTTLEQIGTSATVEHLDSMTFLRIGNLFLYLLLFIRAATNFLWGGDARHFVIVHRCFHGLVIDVGKFWTFPRTIESGRLLGYGASQGILLKNIKQYGYQFIRICRSLFQRNYLVFPTLTLKCEFKSFLLCFFIRRTVTQCLTIISKDNRL